MTVEDILKRKDEQVITFTGDDLTSFCDQMEAAGQALTCGTWEDIRAASRLDGVCARRGRGYMDEEQRWLIGHWFGREWEVPC